ncbi:hypothetical protein AKN40_1183 [Escherichia coli]|nr:hypothetical protein AKN40_1183 [Escherichia coli]
MTNFFAKLNRCQHKNTKYQLVKCCKKCIFGTRIFCINACR